MYRNNDTFGSVHRPCDGTDERNAINDQRNGQHTFNVYIPFMVHKFCIYCTLLSGEGSSGNLSPPFTIPCWLLCVAIGVRNNTQSDIIMESIPQRLYVPHIQLIFICTNTMHIEFS